ncbi:KTSC domain-containing protein [Acetanaerobacterium elongatum]|uniref:KTSC domain-containing protein n=2 Tax=Acetanaerobacterium elongatum TaxID=258515 RepID=A0A1G9YYC5_9FIRM|nr:KTSC domain-containing protein [Acetanaerobacterium elongatum]SDN14162.1 KTSC domain-containing protein [Acetanaerobacterium elongatum]
MLMHPVSSSDLSSVGYENGTLVIRFNSGGTYQYTGVPLSVYQGLMNAPSHGQYFHAYIKNSYPYTRIG